MDTDINYIKVVDQGGGTGGVCIHTAPPHIPTHTAG